MSFKEKALALVDETIEFYSNNPRAILGSHCAYQSSNGCRCAVGRILSETTIERILAFGDNGNRLSVVMRHMTIEFDDEHKWLGEMKRGLLIKLLESLQCLHDESDNWIPEGLTDIGQRTVINIKANIAKYID